MKLRSALLVVLVALTACSGKNTEQVFFDEVSSLSKDEIFARGEAQAEKKKWDDARKYFSFLADSFPNDPLGRRAALRVADSFYARRDLESLTEAQLRYRDFANRYPSDANRAYALLMLGRCYYDQGHGVGRDLTPIREAVQAFTQLIQLFPNSPQTGEAKTLLAECQETLARHELEVGRFYARIRAWEGARLRLQFLVSTYPGTEAAREGSELLHEVERQAKGDTS